MTFGIFLTGSVKAIAESPVASTFENMFQLKHLGFWWDFPKSELGWTKDARKWA